MKSMRLAALTLMIAVAIQACNNGDRGITSPAGGVGGTDPAVYGTVDIRVSFRHLQGNGSAKSAAAESIDRITAYVYSGDESPLVTSDMTIADGRFSGSISVPANVELSIVLIFYDGDIVKYMGEKAEVVVEPNTSQSVTIEEEYLGVPITSTTQVIIDNPYKVHIQPVPFALHYEIEESTSSDFAGAVIINSGPDLSIELDKPEGGTYYYRARAITEYGPGPWHSTWKAATVVMNVENSIDLDGDIPVMDPKLSNRLIDFENGGSSDWDQHKDPTYYNAYRSISGGDLDGTGSSLLWLHLPIKGSYSNPEKYLQKLSTYYTPSAYWMGYSTSFDVMRDNKYCILTFNFYEQSPDITPRDCYCVAFDSGNTVSLCKVVDGEFEVLGSGGESLAGVTYHMDVVVDDGLITVYQDGLEIVRHDTSTDAGRLTRGAFGFYAFNQSDRTQEFFVDNINVTNIFQLVDPGTIIVPKAGAR